jgi:hypothetical protein
MVLPLLFVWLDQLHRVFLRVLPVEPAKTVFFFNCLLDLVNG